MRYEFAPDLQVRAEKIIVALFPHIKPHRVRCLRSYGSSTKRTIARCHALGKLMQKAMGTSAFYALEFLSEKFDKLDEVEQTKVIIHELMHIPKTFGGGFKHHDWVTERNVHKHYLAYEAYQKKEDATKNNHFPVQEKEHLRRYFGH